MSKLYTEEQVSKAIKLAQKCESDCGGVYFDYENTSEIIEELNPIELPTEEEIDEKFNDFLQKELEIGISDKATIERIEWYYNTYFKRHKIKGGQDNE